MKSKLIAKVSLAALVTGQVAWAEDPSNDQPVPPQAVESAPSQFQATPPEGEKPFSWQREQMLRRSEELLLNRAVRHEALRLQAEQQRNYLTENDEELLRQALEEQDNLIKHYDAMRKQAEEQRDYISLHHKEFLQQAIDRQESLARHHQSISQRALDNLESLGEQIAQARGLTATPTTSGPHCRTRWAGPVAASLRV